VDYPDPVAAALQAEEAGAHGITVHLREDRRHIQDRDVEALVRRLRVPLNLEMAVTDAMVEIALRLRPAHVCLVPERREELTTEGGLDVVRHAARVGAATARLAGAGIRVSHFVDPDATQVSAALAAGAHAVELHTGDWANAAGMPPGGGRSRGSARPRRPRRASGSRSTPATASRSRTWGRSPRSPRSSR